MEPDPRCLCGGYGVRQYQNPDTGEVYEEPCFCVPLGTPVAAPVGLTAGDLLVEVGKRWEAAGRGPWRLNGAPEK